jgi:hypothetical protein
MSRRIDREKRLRELVDIDLPPDELRRVARVDALLRITAARELDGQGLSSLPPGSATARLLPGALRRARLLSAAANPPGRYGTLSSIAAPRRKPARCNSAWCCRPAEGCYRDQRAGRDRSVKNEERKQ